MQSISHHPVHIVDSNSNGSLAPSAFIPFCEFGAEKSIMGVKIPEFDVPVCNKFKPVMMYSGQVCYQVDVNEFKDSVRNVKRGLEAGLTFWMDYNLEKQVTSGGRSRNRRSRSNFAEKYFKKERSNKAFIYIGTLGDHIVYCSTL